MANGSVHLNRQQVRSCRFRVDRRQWGSFEWARSPGPVEPAGGFWLEAVRRAFGADDAQRRMPSAWMISSKLYDLHRCGRSRCPKWQVCSGMRGSKGLHSLAGVDYIEWQN